MSKGDIKRQAIFDYYKSNLNFLIENDFLTGDKDVYVCPICLKHHESINSNDPLILEDAPPKSLGGSANTLTCKSCNNTCGHKIDFHLTERLREIESAQLKPNTETKVKVKIDNQAFQGTLKVEEDGTLKMYHSHKNNHSVKLDETMETIEDGETINLEFLKSRVIPENLEYALLKTGYLLAFEKFGYSLIFDDCFAIVRDQLLNPETRIYPTGFWFSPPYPKELSGVYFICDKGIESLIAIFNLDTGLSERMFGTILPLSVIPVEEVIVNLHKKFGEARNTELTLYPLDNDEADYLFDLENIQAMHEWIAERASKES